MDQDTYWILTLVNVILTTASVAALIYLVASKDERGIVSWTAAVFSLAAACFLAGTFMGTMLAVWSTGQPYWLIRYFVPQPLVGEEWLLNVMVPGWIALLAGVGLSGWIRSMAVGIVSMIPALGVLVLTVVFLVG